MSPYAYSTRIELQADGVNPLVQTPGSFVPQEQGAYFPQEQVQQGLPPQGYYGQQPLQQLVQQQYTFPRS
jgi:hypothetical protein